jgi:hypothetical protein
LPCLPGFYCPDKGGFRADGPKAEVWRSRGASTGVGNGISPVMLTPTKGTSIHPRLGPRAKRRHRMGSCEGQTAVVQRPSPFASPRRTDSVPQRERRSRLGVGVGCAGGR